MTEACPGIVFMGTPDFAAGSLDAIVKAGFTVLAVVTVPDKPSGRGQKITISPVKDYALKHNLRLMQPVKLKDEAFISELKSLNADIFVVVAFRMLPEEVWSIPHLGTFNAHASLLPQYRGAAPINHAIINGEKKSGVTTFLIDKQIDTGKIIFQEETLIDSQETAGDLHDRLMGIAAELVVKTIDALADHTVTPFVQPGASDKNLLKAAPKIFPADTFINWHSTSENVHNFIRGLSPYPGARTIIVSGTERLTLKMLGSKKCNEAIEAGKIIISGSGSLMIGCNEGSVEITMVQAEGRKKMPATDFLRGFDISKWIIES